MKFAQVRLTLIIFHIDVMVDNAKGLKTKKRDSVNNLTFKIISFK